MAYDTVEQSAYLGNLVEHFRFLVNATEYLYTSAPTDQTLSTGTAEQNGTYTATPIALSNLEHVRDHGDFIISITVPRDNTVAELFRGYVPDEGVQVWVYRKHVSDNEITTWFAGEVLSCEWRESQAILQCQPNIGKMRRLGLWMRWQPTCNLQVYSTRCGVDPADFTDSVTISAIDGLTLTVTGMPVVADGYYNGGYITDADGVKRHITLHEGADLTVLLDTGSLAATDVISITAGCDGQHTTCREKFFPSGGAFVSGTGNILNFFGYFTTPSRNPFTQGGLGGGGGPTGWALLDNLSGGGGA
jgi:uncharacterized phage protein (TIGR02218 family)